MRLLLLAVVSLIALPLTESGLGNDEPREAGASPSPIGSLSVFARSSPGATASDGSGPIEDFTPDSQDGLSVPPAMSGGFDCLEGSEEGGFTITAEMEGCFNTEIESVELTWSPNRASLVLGLADVSQKRVRHMSVTAVIAREIASRFLEVLAAPEESKFTLCTDWYKATLTWNCGTKAGRQEFEESDCHVEGEGVIRYSHAERMFVLARDLIAGGDLRGVKWPGLEVY